MRTTTYPTHLAAEVRRYFSLEQAELARYLGVTAVQTRLRRCRHLAA